MNHFDLTVSLNIFAKMTAFKVICGTEKRTAVKIKITTMIHLFSKR
jgi:hypothetical protein